MSHLITAFLLICISAQAHGATGGGPHGGTVVKDAQSTYEVQVDEESRVVKVYTLRSLKPRPKQMAVTLFENPETGQTVELQAVNPRASLPEYRGVVGPGAGNFIGFELKLNFPHAGGRVLRHMR